MDWEGAAVTGTGPPLAIRLLGEQRKRCLATILNAAEGSSWWGRLSDAQQTQYREQVRSAVSVFYDLTRDLLKVTDDDGVRNDLTLDLMRALHSQQREIKERLERT